MPISPTISQIAAEHNTYKYEQLIYPSELENDPGLGHYVIFHINESRGSAFRNSIAEQIPGKPGFAGFKQAVATKAYEVLTGQRTAEADIAMENQSKERQILSLNETTVRSKESIILYMPEQMSSTYGLEYEDTSLAGAAQLMGAGKSVRDLISGSGGWTEVVGAGADIVKTLGTSAVEGVAGKVVPGAKGFISAAMRQVKNPHMNVLFKSVSPRTFSFEFNFMPKNEKEAQVVHDIIKRFKFHAHPELSGGLKGGKPTGTFLIYPAEFEIEFYSHGTENNFLHKMGVCVCTSIGVNYAPDGQLALHERTDGKGMTTGNPPVRTTLSLAFKEVELLNKTRIKDGY